MEGGARREGAIPCTILSIDHRDMYYRVCSICEKTLPSPNLLCNFCSKNNNNASSKRLFRILMSIATDTKVVTVICFDRVARVLFGCSADEFFNFAKLHPFSGVTVNEILEGEMFTVTFSKSVSGNAQHTRLASAVPLSSVFRPVIQVLRECYGSQHGS
ncbi:uncharacterized protein LOC130748191 [Lotus japonicus]|uniref:uncharacterized protein LOC130748191 n=1 Tax=Lotus japonicus TaxID=34305 RepID=UPI002585BD32|nr:uncharacterized protein LOC130748191 [Lotus japonicus]